MSWFLFILSIALVLWVGYWLFRGRVLYRGVILLNFIVALQFLGVYLVVVEDFIWIDILSRPEIAAYLVRPLIGCFALIVGVNTFFLGKKHG